MTRQIGLSIGQLAALTGVHLETVRYYERIGLMPAPARTAGGHRVYSDAHRQRLAFAQRARKLGFSIEDVRNLLALSEPARRSCRDVEVIAAAHLENVRAKIADLRRLEQLLTAAVTRCHTDDNPSCPVLDMLESG
jgi:MerR family mercuric resistance operon transcriptional regulator